MFLATTDSPLQRDDLIWFMKSFGSSAEFFKWLLKEANLEYGMWHDVLFHVYNHLWSKPLPQQVGDKFWVTMGPKW